MYFLLSKDGRRAFYFFDNREYVIGRKDCDVSITDDSSISRKHASLLFKKGAIEITDLGAKYNTFVNGSQLRASTPTILNLNDEIKFGILHSVYIVKQQKLNVTSSGLQVDEKKLLAKIIKRLDGNVFSQWSKDSSHLTVQNIMLTLKVLCALIEGQPIITLSFWPDLLKNVNSNLPPPDFNDYKPNYADNILSKNIKFNDEHLRKTLFTNKVFVFRTKLSKAKIETLVELAGGSCICWNEKHLTKEKFSSNNPQYLLIQDDQCPSDTNQAFMNMISYLHSIGKRSIPVQEIAMAIVLSSCEKDCNPDFDRTGTLVRPNEQIIFTSDMLAPETQAQDDDTEEKPSIYVAETADNFSIVPKCGSSADEEDEIKKIDKPVSVESNDLFSSDISAYKQKNIVTSTQKEGGKSLKPFEEYSEIIYNQKETDHSGKGIASNALKNSKRLRMGSQPQIIIETVIIDEPNSEEKKVEKNSLISENGDIQLVEPPSLKRIGEELNKGAKKQRSDTDEKEWMSKEKWKPAIPIDLTQDDEIVTFTQTEKDQSVRIHAKQSDANQKASPFGFAKCGVKNKNLAKVSDFFKPIPKSTKSTRESTGNLSTAVDSTIITTSKRKSIDDIFPSGSTNEQGLPKNPFAFPKRPKTESKTNASPFERTAVSTTKKNISKANNPFATRVTRSGTTTAQDRVEETFVPYVFEVTVIDLTIENNHGWLSKTTIVKEEVSNVSKNTTEEDEKLQKFMESFNNCVIVETLPLITEKRSLSKNSETISNNNRNFKKFTKVKPLHIQTMIVPSSSYRNVICNNISDNEDKM